MTRTNGMKLLSAAATAAVMAFATPVFADEGKDIVLNIGGDTDLLETLIKLDAADIADMRAEIADARKDIEDAIRDVEEARREAADAPVGARVIVRIAFAAAREATEVAVNEAMTKAFREIDDAERRLQAAAVSADERAETQGAIDALREDLEALSDSLRDLLAALEA